MSHSVFPRVRLRSLCLVVAVAAATALAGVTSAAATGSNPLRGVARVQAQQAAASSGTVASPEQGEGSGDALKVADQAEQYAGERSAPADSVSAAALIAAREQAATLPTARGAQLSEVTDQPLDAEPSGYTDPYWSNAGAGFRDVSGRTTALAVDGATYYAGTADGGVWKSTDSGGTWHSIWDGQNSLSIGALLVTSDHALWVGTGEANTSSDSYLGTGVYRSTNGGASFARVGGDELIDGTTFRLLDDGAAHVYAATSNGLYRHSSATSAGSWTLVLKPDPNPSGSPYDTSFITDVAVKPGTHGQSVLAVLGWRNGTPYNGFYLSTTGGGPGSFSKITPRGDIRASDVGRTTLAYAADGSRLYAIVQSVSALLAGGDTNLQGVYVSRRATRPGRTPASPTPGPSAPRVPRCRTSPVTTSASSPGTTRRSPSTPRTRCTST